MNKLPMRYEEFSLSIVTLEKTQLTVCRWDTGDRPVCVISLRVRMAQVAALRSVQLIVWADQRLVIRLLRESFDWQQTISGQLIECGVISRVGNSQTTNLGLTRFSMAMIGDFKQCDQVLGTVSLLNSRCFRLSLIILTCDLMIFLSLILSAGVATKTRTH